MKKFNTYYIWARQSNGGILYYVINSNGINMIPNALSLAFPLVSRSEAILYKKALSEKYKGLEFHYSSFQSGSRLNKSID